VVVAGEGTPPPISFVYVGISLFYILFFVCGGCVVVVACLLACVCVSVWLSGCVGVCGRWVGLGW
jgi:hypothetical protein